MKDLDPHCEDTVNVADEDEDGIGDDGFKEKPLFLSLDAPSKLSPSFLTTPCSPLSITSIISLPSI